MKKILINTIIAMLVISIFVPVNTVSASNEAITSDEPIIFSETFDINDSNPKQKGQISTSKLKLTVSVIKSYRSDSALSSISVQYNYSWLSEPFNRWSDGLNLTWDNSNLRFRDGSFTKKDYYFNDTLKKQVLFSHEKTPGELESKGVGWFADIAGWHLTPKKSEGYGHFILEPKTTIKTGSVQLFANYAHALSGGLSIAIKGVSVSFSGSHDKQATSKTINLQKGKV